MDQYFLVVVVFEVQSAMQPKPVPLPVPPPEPVGQLNVQGSQCGYKPLSFALKLALGQREGLITPSCIQDFHLTCLVLPPIFL